MLSEQQYIQIHRPLEVICNITHVSSDVVPANYNALTLHSITHRPQQVHTQLLHLPSQHSQPIPPALLINLVQQLMVKYLVQPEYWAQHADYCFYLDCALVQSHSTFLYL